MFHYTPVFRAVMILRDGVIRRSTNAPRYVWLSSNPTNEPTACRAVLSMEQIRQCNERALSTFQGPVTAKLCHLATWKLPSISRCGRSPRGPTNYRTALRLPELRASPDTPGAGRTGEMSKVAPILAEICNP